MDGEVKYPPEMAAKLQAFERKTGGLDPHTFMHAWHNGQLEETPDNMELLLEASQLQRLVSLGFWTDSW